MRSSGRCAKNAELFRHHLHAVLDEAQAASVLPDAPGAYDALHDFVIRVRLQG